MCSRVAWYATWQMRCSAVRGCSQSVGVQLCGLCPLCRTAAMVQWSMDQLVRRLYVASVPKVGSWVGRSMLFMSLVTMHPEAPMLFLLTHHPKRTTCKPLGNTYQYRIRPHLYPATMYTYIYRSTLLPLPYRKLWSASSSSCATRAWTCPGQPSLNVACHSSHVCVYIYVYKHA